ncbi:MAG TPA: ATP-binding protein [Polyangia bacterium]|nr:ATP-binding protein [Polyangia bacterium]
MLEAVGRASLAVLGDVCTVDRVADAPPTRILDVRTSPDAWMEAPGQLVAAGPGEITLDGGRSRLSVPIGTRADRFGVLSFARHDGVAHGAAELALAQELGERLALAIGNAREHARAVAALGDRERLISIAAHELRNPLCSVRFCLQALERGGGALAPPGAKLIEIVARGERKIARLIDDLLDLGRIRAGRMEMELSSFDLCDVIRDVGALMEAQTARLRAPLTLELDGPVVGRWDRLRLDQVVSNLLANAVKYGQGRPVTVRAGVDRQRAVGWVAVIDQGVGIAPELQAAIFEPFRRATSIGRGEGLGLGLFIVRGIVEQLGGAVRVESRPGAGSTFVVELPLQVSR